MINHSFTKRIENHRTCVSVVVTRSATSTRYWRIARRHVMLLLILLSFLASIGLALSSLETHSAHATPIPPKKGQADPCIGGTITYQAVSSNTGEGLLTVINNCSETIVMGEIQYYAVQSCFGKTQQYYPATDSFYSIAAGATKKFRFSFLHECVLCDEANMPINWQYIMVGDLGATVHAFKSPTKNPTSSDPSWDGRATSDDIYAKSAIYFDNDMYIGGCGQNVTPYE